MFIEFQIQVLENELLFSLLFYNCVDPETVEPVEYESLTRLEFENGVKLGGARQFNTVGKMIRIEDLVLVTEYDQGIHFIDYSSESSPKKLYFLELPGCEDAAIKDGKLYVKCAVDLVLFDLGLKEELNRFRNIFPQRFDVGDSGNKIILGRSSIN